MIRKNENTCCMDCQKYSPFKLGHSLFYDFQVNGFLYCFCPGIHIKFEEYRGDMMIDCFRRSEKLTGNFFILQTRLQ